MLDCMTPPPCRLQPLAYHAKRGQKATEAKPPADTSGTRVTAIANGNTDGVSTDVLIWVLAATGHRAEVRINKAAA